MNPQIILMSATILLGGCAGTSVAQPEQTARNEVVCEMETPTGSRLPVRVCRTKSTIANDKQSVDMLQDRMNRQGAMPGARPDNP